MTLKEDRSFQPDFFNQSWYWTTFANLKINLFKYISLQNVNQGVANCVTKLALSRSLPSSPSDHDIWKVSFISFILILKSSSTARTITSTSSNLVRVYLYTLSEGLAKSNRRLCFNLMLVNKLFIYTFHRRGHWPVKKKTNLPTYSVALRLLMYFYSYVFLKDSRVYRRSRDP